MKVKIVKEVKRSDSLWRFACGDVYFFDYVDFLDYFDFFDNFQISILKFSEKIDKIVWAQIFSS